MINVMVGYARLARQVSARIYLERRTLADKLATAKELDADLVNWKETVPTELYRGASLQEPDYVERQSITRLIYFSNSRNCSRIAIPSSEIVNASAVTLRYIRRVLVAYRELCFSGLCYRTSSASGVHGPTLVPVLVV